ncbi:MAG TPA: hypothetical protein VGD14_01080 [bacterium]
MENYALTSKSPTITDPAAIAAGEAAKARIQSAYIMAYQKPRDIMESRDRILKACRRTEFAGKAEYSKPIGGTSVKGPSVRFAELALREWGNIMTEVITLYEDANIRRIRISVLDLETNAQFTRDIQIQKTIERRSKKGRENDLISERKNSNGQVVFILHATDEEVHTKESAWVSKVLRNEGLRLIPTDIIEEGIMEAQKTIAEHTQKDPEGEKKRLFDSFSNLGISPKEIQKYIHHSIDVITPSELVNLRTVYQSIRDGESIWLDYTGDPKEGEPEITPSEKNKTERPPAGEYAGKHSESQKRRIFKLGHDRELSDKEIEDLIAYHRSGAVLSVPEASDLIHRFDDIIDGYIDSMGSSTTTGKGEDIPI